MAAEVSGRQGPRVLRPGGVVSFDFVQLVSAEGRQFFEQWRPTPGSESIFRFHHPEVIRTVAELAGFEIIALTSNASRLAFLEARKRAQSDRPLYIRAITRSAKSSITRYCRLRGG
jgi:hypothetical protein